MTRAGRRQTDAILRATSRWWDFVDNRGIVRRIVLGIAIWMTWRAADWSMSYAEQWHTDGLQSAALVAAVQAPITMFCAAVFRHYCDGRNDATNTRTEA